VNPDDIDSFSLRRFCILKPRELKRTEEAVAAVACWRRVLPHRLPSPIVGFVAVIADRAGLCRRMLGPALVAYLLLVVRVVEAGPGSKALRAVRLLRVIIDCLPAPNAVRGLSQH
jgi:hypothetical protein